MDKLARRKFGLLDAIVLVLATAAAMAATRHWWPDYFEVFRPGGEAYKENVVNLMYRVRYLLYSIAYFFASWTLAYLFLRLRRPRPTVRLLTRQPGMVACSTAAIILSLRLVNLAIIFIVYVVWVRAEPALGWLSWWFQDAGELPLIPSEMGCGVAAAWIIQAVGGRWRPEPSWIDRMGRVLGMFWIGMVPFAWFSSNL